MGDVTDVIVSLERYRTGMGMHQYKAAYRYIHK